MSLEWEGAIARELGRLREVSLERRLEVGTCDSAEIRLDLNDYLGLAGAESVVAAAVDATRQWGLGARSAPLLGGWSEEHDGLAEELAAFKGAEAALLFSSGYAANVGVISALVGARDTIFSDRLNHASLVDAARLSGATVRRFRHNDPEHLERFLRSDAGNGRRWIVVDAVYSMDGCLARLPEIVALAKEYDAQVIVDDAHGTGVVGPGGRGTVAHFAGQGVGVDDIAAQVGTLSKALGSQGGFVCCSRTIADFLVNKCRAFVYSTALAPPLVAGARAALRHVVEGSLEARRRAVFERLRTELDALIAAAGLRLIGDAPAPMFAVDLVDADRALRVSRDLRDCSVFAPAVRPPTVPEGTSRLRVAPHAALTDSDIDTTVHAFQCVFANIRS